MIIDLIERKLRENDTKIKSVKELFFDTYVEVEKAQQQWEQIAIAINETPTGREMEVLDLRGGAVNTVFNLKEDANNNCLVMMYKSECLYLNNKEKVIAKAADVIADHFKESKNLSRRQPSQRKNI